MLQMPTRSERSSRVFAVALFAATSLLGAPLRPAAAETYLSVYGTVTFSDDLFRCWNGSWQDCHACSSPPNSNPFGMTTYSLGGTKWGEVSGSISWHTVLDGVQVPSGALPSGSWFEYGLSLMKSQLCGGAYCGTVGVCGITYAVGPDSGFANANTYVPLSKAAGPGTAGETDFSFEFCNFDAHLGCACGIVGCTSQRFRLHTPGPLDARQVPAGDAPPVSFPAAGIVADFGSGPGGVVTGITATGTLPYDTGALGSAWRYWELSNDLQGEPFTVDVTLQYDDSEFPAAVDESRPPLYRFSPACGCWQFADATVDTSANMILLHDLSELAAFALIEPPTGAPELAERGPGLRLAISPNPSAGSAVVRFFVPTPEHVVLATYDVSGRRLCDVVNKWLDVGEHRADITGCDVGRGPLAPGIYFVRLEVGRAATTQRLAIVR